MLYFFVKQLGRVGFRINFRKIFFHYQEQPPEKKATIYAVNHPTAFIDPVLVATYLKRPVNFIVRGDIFVGKVVLAILAGLRMFPIFRFRDGYASLKHNQDTLELMEKKLSQDECILILAEGETKHEKRLRPIQKGTARMAFGAVEKYGKTDIQIVPVGVNYTDSHAFRSFIMVEIGKSFPLEEYMDAHRENPRKAIKQVTDRIQKEMRSLVIHIEDEADDPWVNRILEIQRNDFRYPIFPIRTNDDQLWKQEYQAVEKMNKFSTELKEKARSLREKYDKQLFIRRLRDFGIAQQQSFNPTNSLLLLLGFIPFAIGYITNYLPMAFGENLAKRKVKKIEFYSSIRYGGGLIGYLLYWLILLITFLSLGMFKVVLFIVLMPFLGYFALVYKEFHEKWSAARKFKRIPENERKELMTLRSELLALLD